MLRSGSFKDTQPTNQVAFNDTHTNTHGTGIACHGNTARPRPTMTNRQPGGHRRDRMPVPVRPGEGFEVGQIPEIFVSLRSNWARAEAIKREED